MKPQTIAFLIMILLVVIVAVYSYLPKETLTIIEIPAKQLSGIVIP